jgi:O-methyltransferase
VIKKAVHSLFRAFGLDVIKFDKAPMPADFGPEEIAIIRAVQPFTMTSPERIFALIQGIRYIQKRAIPGSIVECGVWKGGSMAATARALLEKNDVSRDLYLFDTFEGMTDPSSKDVDYSGVSASQVMKRDPGFKCANAPLEEVKSCSTPRVIPVSEFISYRERWRTPFPPALRRPSRCSDSIRTGMSPPGTN